MWAMFGILVLIPILAVGEGLHVCQIFKKISTNQFESSFMDVVKVSNCTVHYSYMYSNLAQKSCSVTHNIA